MQPVGSKYQPTKFKVYIQRPTKDSDRRLQECRYLMMHSEGMEVLAEALISNMSKLINFKAVADAISCSLIGDRWKKSKFVNNLLILQAIDVPEGVRHTIFFSQPFKFIDQPGGPWMGIACNVQVLFEHIEFEIAKRLKWPTSSNVSAIFSFGLMVPDKLTYARTAFLIDASSEERMEKTVKSLLALYSEFVEPVRQSVARESCLDDSDFYPHDSPLVWELRRVAYYGMKKRKSWFDGYADHLKARLDDYEIGLAGDQGFWAQDARRSINEIRSLIHTYQS